MLDLHYLQLLSKEYPTIQDAASEIIRLNAIMSLPKGTEYFFSDLHGEHEAFIHLLRSASGNIRIKIDDLFDKSVSQAERIELSTLIYYPEKELARIKQDQKDSVDWCKITIYRLLEICKHVSVKYTRQQFRNRLPGQYATLIDELLHVDSASKAQFFEAIIKSLVDTEMVDVFITSLCELIRELSIYRLHIIGDIYDRGPRADAIMNVLMAFHHVDVQWGNHDISWMGAMAGNLACIANVIRLGISYNNFDLLEDGYGINLRPLSVFAAQVYHDDPCKRFEPHTLDENKYDSVDISLASKMHKAIAVIQFKLESQLIARHPEYGMEDRRLLEKVDFANGCIQLADKSYPLMDALFPTVDPARPLELTAAEEDLMKTIATSFRHSEKLQKHIRFLYNLGSMYLTINGNLLYHGCIPLTEQGTFENIKFNDRDYAGKAYLDYIDDVVRQAHYAPAHSPEQHDARDFLWYLWCGPKSPLFGKNKMTTFERYFIADKTLHKETMNPYFHLLDTPGVCENILREFGLDPKVSHIVNGHVPVRIQAGESPIKGGGRLFVIDGGISKAYQKQTGIGGYTLIFNSHDLTLAQHSPYHTDDENRPIDFTPTVQVVEKMPRRLLVADTDESKIITVLIAELHDLLKAYRDGSLEESFTEP